MRTSTLAGPLRRTCRKYSFPFLLMLLPGDRDGPAGVPAMATTVAGTTMSEEQFTAGHTPATGTPDEPGQRPPGPGAAHAAARARAAPVIAPIGVEGKPHVDIPLVFGAAFTDVNRRDAHLALWSWGDGSQAPASVHSRNGAGSIKGRHAYRKAGVYTVRLTVLDSGGQRATATRQVVVRSAGQVAGEASIAARPAGDRADIVADPAAR